MRNALFRFLGTLAVSALFMMNASAWTSPGIAPVLSRSYSSSNDFASLLSFKLPHYEQWKSLPPEAQRRVIESIQEFLLQADAEARHDKQSTASLQEVRVLERLFGLWLETAEAKPRKRRQAEQQPYCINQGVVKPLSECDTSLGYKMHDFDTNEVLSKLGSASKCPAGLKPCSPFFGFSSDGQMFCSSKNLTRDCSQQSKQAGTISLVNVMRTCELGSPGAAKVDCKALKEFYNQQIDVVQKLCQKAPKRYACGILKDQMHEVLTEASEKTSASAAVGLDKIADTVKATIDAAQMSPNSVPCPTEEETKEKPPAPKEVCAQKTLSKEPAKPTLKAITDELVGEKPDQFVCGVVTLPNQAKIGLDLTKEVMIVQSGPHVKPVVLDLIEAQIFQSISAGLLDEPFKISPKELLSHYLPKEEMKDPGKISVESKSGKPNQDFPSKGWVTPSGTRIRYIPGANFGTDSKPMVLASIQPSGGGKEHIVGVQINLPDAEEAESKDSKAAPSQPK